jgi:hypothetical protein
MISQNYLTLDDYFFGREHKDKTFSINTLLED